MRDFAWSKSEKSIARRAFEKALQSEFVAIKQRLQSRINNASEMGDVGDLYRELGRILRDVQEKYDYRYSVLIFKFAWMIREGWISEADLDGLGEEKLAAIKLMLKP